MKLSDHLRPLTEPDRTKFAAECGTTYAHLRNVAFSGKSCGPALAVAIEQRTSGGVRRWDLRPSDWHLIWPELIGSESAPTLPEETRNAA